MRKKRQKQSIITASFFPIQTLAMKPSGNQSILTIHHSVIISSIHSFTYSQTTYLLLAMSYGISMPTLFCTTILFASTLLLFLFFPFQFFFFLPPWDEIYRGDRCLIFKHSDSSNISFSLDCLPSSTRNEQIPFLRTALLWVTHISFGRSARELVDRLVGVPLLFKFQRRNTV